MTLTMMTQMKILISNQEQPSKKTSTERGAYCTDYTDGVITCKKGGGGVNMVSGKASILVSDAAKKKWDLRLSA